jgi:hypothetical protein
MTTVDLSVVYATRDDNYAAGVNTRLARSIKRLQRVARKTGINIETLVVDWNSPPSGSMAVVLRALGIDRTRVVVVGSGTARPFVDLASRDFVEFAAKNVGVMNASGSQVLTTNADVLLSEKAILACVKRPFPSDSFLRGDRLDFRYNRLGIKEPTYLHVRHGPTPADTIHRKVPTPGRRARLGSDVLTGEDSTRDFIVGPVGGLPHHFIRGLHTNASGDFLCAPRNAWHDLGGFAHDRWTTNMGDSLMCARLLGQGLRQVVLRDYRAIMHEEHPRSESANRSWDESKWPDFLNELLREADRPEVTPPGNVAQPTEIIDL